MTFKLLKKSANACVVKFHIVNARGDIIGQANVPPNEVSDLQKCWRDSTPAAAKQSTAATALVNALKRGPRLSRQGVLRGC